MRPVTYGKWSHFVINNVWLWNIVPICRNMPQKQTKYCSRHKVKTIFSSHILVINCIWQFKQLKEGHVLVTKQDATAVNKTMIDTAAIIEQEDPWITAAGMVNMLHKFYCSALTVHYDHLNMRCECAREVHEQTEADANRGVLGALVSGSITWRGLL